MGAAEWFPLASCESSRLVALREVETTDLKILSPVRKPGPLSRGLHWALGAEMNS